MVQVGLDFTLLIQIAQFFIIIFMVKFFIVNPIYSAMDGRNSKIASLMERAKASLSAIEAKKAEYDAQLKAVRTEITEYHNQIKTDAAHRTQAMLDKIKSETNAELEKARTGIENEISAVRSSLRGDVDALSQQIIHAVTK